MISRTNKFCKYFPCHTELEDCIFCYCPFYPCCDTNYGNYVYSQKQKKKIWSCQNCNWIHKRSVVDNIFALIRKQGKLSFDPAIFATSNKLNIKKAWVNDTGVIILAHGSKLKKANNILFKIVRIVKKELGIKNVVATYLQFCKPDLNEGIKYLVEKSSKTIIIVPFFLFSGNHVTRDIPEILKEEEKKYPGVKFIYTKNLGDDSKIEEVVISRVKEAL